MIKTDKMYKNIENKHTVLMKGKIKMKIRITTVEQGWLDSFNNRFGTEFKNNEIIEDETIVSIDQFGEKSIYQAVDEFNHYVACGPAIELEDVKNGDSEEK